MNIEKIKITSKIYRNIGFSLLEILIVVMVISIAFLGMVKGYFGISKGLLDTRQRTVSTNLAQEEIETVKKMDYPKIYVTSQEDMDDYGYDNTYFPPESYTVSGKVYTRYVTIKKLKETSGDLVEIPPINVDEGLKRLKVDVDWEVDGQTKRETLYSIIQDPDRADLSGAITGTVRDSADLSDVLGAVVFVVENSNWSATTDSNGEFEMTIATGTWNLTATKSGYLDETNGAYTVVTDALTTVPLGDLDMSAVGTGAIWGLVKSTSDLPIEGAIVTCNDETSHAVVTLSTSSYGDPNKNYVISTVSTGTWTVYATTGTPLNLFGSSETIVVSQGSSVNCEVILSSTTSYGSISGIANMSDTGDDSGIKISASGVTAFTDTSGNYTLENISTGSVTITANPGGYDDSYTANMTTVTVFLGQNAVADNMDIYPAGTISGTIYTVGGVDPFPNIPMQAIDTTGIERGVDLSQADGSYEIKQLPVFGNPYTVSPIIDDEDVSNPEELDISVTKGGDDSSNDFIITPSWGYIRGSVTKNSIPIEDGVIILASTSTLAASPPDIYLGATGIYGGISYSGGVYEIKVRSNKTYNVYAWYTELSGSGTSTSLETDTGITLTGTPPAATVDLNWP